MLREYPLPVAVMTVTKVALNAAAQRADCAVIRLFHLRGSLSILRVAIHAGELLAGDYARIMFSKIAVMRDSGRRVRAPVFLSPSPALKFPNLQEMAGELLAVS